MNSKASGSGSVRRTSSHAPRGRDSSYFGLFSIIGAFLLSFNALNGCLAVFSLRSCLAN